MSIEFEADVMRKMCEKNPYLSHVIENQYKGKCSDRILEVLFYTYIFEDSISEREFLSYQEED